MPHIIIEHDKFIAKEIDLASFAAKLHECMASQETVDISALRTRTHKAKNLIIGDGSIKRMIHIEVTLLEGRSEELKLKMAKDLFGIGSDFLGEMKCSLTVNIDELGTYIK